MISEDFMRDFFGLKTKPTGRVSTVAIKWSLWDCDIVIYMPSRMTEEEIGEVEKVFAMQMEAKRRANRKEAEKTSDSILGQTPALVQDK